MSDYYEDVFCHDCGYQVCPACGCCQTAGCENCSCPEVEIEEEESE